MAALRQGTTASFNSWSYHPLPGRSKIAFMSSNMEVRSIPPPLVRFRWPQYRSNSCAAVNNTSFTVSRVPSVVFMRFSHFTFPYMIVLPVVNFNMLLTMLWSAR
jgi:hypothetical protein